MSFSETIEKPSSFPSRIFSKEESGIFNFKEISFNE
jgi:hypothetical protein